MRIADLEATLEPLLAAWRDERELGEAFGDFTLRKGFSELQKYATVYKPALKNGAVKVGSSAHVLC